MTLLDPKVKVRRGNVIYTVDRDDIRRYLDKGFDVIDTAGNVVQEAEPKDPASIRLAYIKQKEEIKRLRQELDNLRGKLPQDVKVSTETASATEPEAEQEPNAEEVQEPVDEAQTETEEVAPKKRTRKK